MQIETGQQGSKPAALANQRGANRLLTIPTMLAPSRVVTPTWTATPVNVMWGTNPVTSAAGDPRRGEAITLNGVDAVAVRLPSAMSAPLGDAAPRTPAAHPERDAPRLTLERSDRQ